MNNVTSKDTEQLEKRGGGFFGGLRALLSPDGDEASRRALILDLVVFFVALLFSRCHVLFGTHPLGIAWVAVLPTAVWAAGLGAIVGSLTLGEGGIIYAIISVIVVFLRVIISGSGKREAALFDEGLLLRMSASVIGGFIAAVYEVLLSGFTTASILFGAGIILLPPVATFVFSWLFSTGFTLPQLTRATNNIFSLSGKEDTEKYNVIFFQLSSVATLFLLALSLAEFSLFGISASYIFVSFTTLLVAKRFGALRALAVGFITSLGISGVYSVSFALSGLGAGLLFAYGIPYALVGGGAALSAWSAYSGGLEGFLTTLPEYLIAASLSLPLLKHLATEKGAEEASSIAKTAQDMVGTMALSYQNKCSASLDSLEASLSSLSGVIREYSARSATPSLEEYKNIVLDVSDRYCRDCSGLGLCEAENISPCTKNADIIAEKLSSGESVSAEDVNGDTEFCQKAELIGAAINRAAARARQECYKLKESGGDAEEYELISKLINEARCRDEAERRVDSSLTESLSAVMESCGFGDGVIRTFGERRKHFILAGEDESGDKITSRELREGIEAAAGVRLGSPEYFRRGKMALMECGVRRSYRVECATASASGGGEVSGDTAAAFESSDERFFALLSDGMGCGEEARDTSQFVAKFMRRILDFGASKDTALHLLNHLLRRRPDECSATVDLFELDLLLGEAVFIKSGAAPSYVKRGSSLFRIKSQTAPLGLIRNIDTERIRVEIRPDDYVIILSDGICQSSEEAPWLLELLSKPVKGSLKDYAQRILGEAAKSSKSRDDMSVMVLKITKESPSS